MTLASQSKLQQLDVDQISSQLAKYDTRVHQLEEGLPKNSVVADLKDKLEVTRRMVGNTAPPAHFQKPFLTLNLFFCSAQAACDHGSTSAVCGPRVLERSGGCPWTLSGCGDAHPRLLRGDQYRRPRHQDKGGNKPTEQHQLLTVSTEQTFTLKVKLDVPSQHVCRNHENAPIPGQIKDYFILFGDSVSCFID